MDDYRFVLHNTGDEHNNDQVDTSGPFPFHDYRYTFTIQPKTSFWRFGIRLSKTKDIEFYHPEHRYKGPDFYEKYIDIHIGVGEFDNLEFTLPNKFQFVQYNIPSGVFKIVVTRLSGCFY